MIADRRRVLAFDMRDAISPSVPDSCGEGGCSFRGMVHSQDIVIRDDNVFPGRIDKRGHHDGGLAFMLLEGLNDGPEAVCLVVDTSVGVNTGVGRWRRLFGLDCRYHLVHRRRVGMWVAAVHVGSGKGLRAGRQADVSLDKPSSGNPSLVPGGPGRPIPCTAQLYAFTTRGL